MKFAPSVLSTALLISAAGCAAFVPASLQRSVQRPSFGVVYPSSTAAWMSTVEAEKETFEFTVRSLDISFDFPLGYSVTLTC